MSCVYTATIAHSKERRRRPAHKLMVSTGKNKLKHHHRHHRRLLSSFSTFFLYLFLSCCQLQFSPPFSQFSPVSHRSLSLLFEKCREGHYSLCELLALFKANLDVKILHVLLRLPVTKRGTGRRRRRRRRKGRSWATRERALSWDALRIASFTYVEATSSSSSSS